MYDIIIGTIIALCVIGLIYVLARNFTHKEEPTVITVKDLLKKKENKVH